MNKQLLRLAVLVVLVISVPRGFAQLYVDGTYSGDTYMMGCTAHAKYMSGTLNWTIDYDWYVTATATVSGPRSNSNSNSAHGEVSTGASVGDGPPAAYPGLPGGCYYFQADGTATSETSGQTAAQGGRLGDLCFDVPPPPPVTYVLFVYSNVEDRKSTR